MSQVSSKHFIRAKFCVFSFLAAAANEKFSVQRRILFKVPADWQFETDRQTAEQEMARKLIKFTQEMAGKKEERRKVAKRNGKSAPNLAKSDEQTRIKLPLILFGVDFRGT